MALEKKDKEWISDVLKTLSRLDFQLHDESKRRTRNKYKRDYTRILYSSSFRRLQGKMQLLGVKNDRFYRNRLTHSLEATQIARAIAEKLNYSRDEIYVIEAAALAHDIGNPPFGHAGERILDELSKEIGGFEGNAQTLRVLMHLEKKNPDSKGLNLTLRTLMAVTKYFVKRDNPGGIRQRKYIYDEDYDNLFRNLHDKGILVRTLDVQIVDLADEIAYAAHDLEDALSMKLFTIDELLYEFKIKQEKYDYNRLKLFIEQAENFALQSTNYKSSEEYAFLLRKELTSILVHALIEDIALVDLTDEFIQTTGTQHSKELGFKSLYSLAKNLKTLTFKTINRTDYIQLYETQGEKVIRGLYEVFSDISFNKDGRLLPVEYRCADCKETQKRLITDYIAGMMDSYAISTYQKYFGIQALDKVYNLK